MWPSNLPSQLHIADVTAEGIQPDLLVVSVNACVTWVWSDGTCCNLQEISQQGEVQGTLQPSHRVHFKRYIHVEEQKQKQNKLKNKKIGNNNY